MTQVVIDDVIPRTQLVSAAGQTVFNTNWTADAATDVLVYARANGEEPDDASQRISSSLYNVTFIGGSETVRVTFLDGRDLDDVITIVRATPAERSNLYVNTNFVPSMLNQDFGILTLVDQQAQMYDTVVNPGYNVSATIASKDKVLPTLNAQQVWRMNEANTAFEAYTIDGVPAPSNSYFITYGADPSLENEQNLALLGNGILKQTVAAGFSTVAIAVPGVDYLDPSLPLGTMAYQDANNVNITGGTAALTAGSVVNSPTNGSDLVNKSYADSIAAGFQFKASCNAATTGALNTTYNNGASGVGATLTANVNGAIVLDGVSLNINERVLVKDQAAPAENGIYTVTTVGNAGAPFVITRATDFDQTGEIQPGSIIFILSGTLYNDTSFVETEPVVTVGTDPIIFIQFSQQFPVSMGNGGTGASITPIPNAVFSSNGSSVGQLSTTLPSGLTIPGYAQSGANSDITSMTGLTGVLKAPTQVQDANSNEVLIFGSTASAINEFTMTNAAIGNGPTFSASGGDTNINANFVAKGTGQIVERSENTTIPVVWQSGTTLQHTTNWNIADTAQTRNVTLQDASGTLAFLTDLDWELITTASANNTSTVQAFTGLAGYSQICIVYSNVLVATNGAQLALQGSIDNGSNYLTTAGQYFYQVITSSNTAIAAAATTVATGAPLSNGGSNLANSGLFGMVFVTGMTSTSQRKGFNASSYFFSTTPLPASYESWGNIVTTSAVNALRFITSSGNIAAGDFYVYGIR